MDAYAIKSLDNLLVIYKNYEIIVSYFDVDRLANYVGCRNKLCINNGIIFCKKKSQIMKNLIEKIIKNNKCALYESHEMCIVRVTGQIIFTEHLLLPENKKFVKLLSNEYLEPCIFTLCNITNNTYTVHNHAFSWASPIISKLIIFYIKYKFLFFLCLIIFVVIIIVLLLFIKKIYNSKVRIKF